MVEGRKDTGQSEMNRACAMNEIEIFEELGLFCRPHSGPSTELNGLLTMPWQALGQPSLQLSRPFSLLAPGDPPAKTTFGNRPFGLVFRLHRCPGHCCLHWAPADPLSLPLDSVVSGGHRNRGNPKTFASVASGLSPPLHSTELSSNIALQSPLGASTSPVQLAPGFGLESVPLDLRADPHIFTASSALQPHLSATLSFTLATGHSRIPPGPYRSSGRTTTSTSQRLLARPLATSVL